MAPKSIQSKTAFGLATAFALLLPQHAVAQPAAEPAQSHWNTPSSGEIDDVLGYYGETGSHQKACSGGAAGSLSWVIMHWTDADDDDCGVADIRAVNPGVKVLAYQNIGGMITAVNDEPSTCVTQQQADAHEAFGTSWYVHWAITGTRIHFSDYDYLAAADIASTSYAQQCTKNLDEIASAGFDGVFLDDANTFPGHGFNAPASVEYPTDSEYGEAAVDLVRTMSGAAGEHGLLTAANVAMNPWSSSQRPLGLQMFQPGSAGPGADAFFREHWMCWNTCWGATFMDNAFASTVSLMTDIQALGAPVLAMTNRQETPAGQDPTRFIQYAQAAWLLAWDGHSPSAWGFYHNDPEHVADYAPAVGKPSGEKTPVGLSGHAWLRYYQQGAVLVNGSSIETVTVKLDGSYHYPDGSRAKVVTLQPRAGVVLIKGHDHGSRGGPKGKPHSGGNPGG